MKGEKNTHKTIGIGKGGEKKSAGWDHPRQEGKGKTRKKGTLPEVSSSSRKKRSSHLRELVPSEGTIPKKGVEIHHSKKKKKASIPFEGRQDLDQRGKKKGWVSGSLQRSRSGRSASLQGREDLSKGSSCKMKRARLFLLKMATSSSRR